MRRLMVLLLGAPLLLLAPAHGAATTGWHVWRGTGTGEMRSGTLDQGEYIYPNTLWLAKGANGDGLERDDYFADALPDDPGMKSSDLRRALKVEFFGMGRSVTNGDYALPSDHEAWPDGTGEASELRLAADAHNLYVRVRFTSFPRRTAQIATLAFAHGGGPANAWPANAKLKSPYAVALTLSGTASTVTTSGGSSRGVGSRAGDHTLEARVPLSMLPPAPWTLTGGSGLADPANPEQYWGVPAGPQSATHPGSGGAANPTNVWGLLFADDRPWSFDELRQSRLLTQGVATGASVEVDVRDLQAHRTRATPLRRGDVPRVYDSRFDFGDGIARSPGVVNAPDPPAGVPIGEDFNVTYTRTGRQQDYAMRVPQAYTSSRSWPLLVYLHGFGGTPEEAFALPLGLVDEAEKRGYLVAALQGRGDTFYRPGLGELDVLEVLRDVERHFRVDPSRVYLMGHSMGGYGTNNITSHLPDMWAAAAPVEGTDSTSLSPNLRHVPWLMITADEDLDPMGAAANGHYDLLSALGYDATLLQYHLKTHEYSTIYDTLPRLFAHFAAHRLDPNPGVVTWVRPPAADDKPALSQVHDGAYWLRGVDAGSVTVESDAIPHLAYDPAKAVRAVIDPIDEGGPSGRTQGILKTTRPSAGAAITARNRLHITARGASTISVDLRRARLAPAWLTVASSSNRALTLRLTNAGGTGGGYFGVRLDARHMGPLDLQDGVATLHAPAGQHVLLITYAVPGSGAGDDGSLPATGGIGVLAVAAVLTCCAAVGLRIRLTL